MKKICLYLLLSLFLFGCHQETRWSDIDGHSLRLSDFRKQWLIINYWAHWCKPCYTEMPELNAIHKKDNITVLGVSYDEAPASQLKQWANKLGIQFPVLLHDPAAQLGIKSIPGLPTTIIINPQGQVAKLLYGPQTQQSLQRIMDLLENMKI